jgi:hypothetical protein
LIFSSPITSTLTHVAVLAPAHDPAALLAAAQVAAVADLPDFLFVASLAGACCQAGSTECLHGWAELAARHGVITLDAFAGSSSGDAYGSSCGAGAATSGPSADVAAAAADAAPQPIQLRKMLSMVAEVSEECSFDGSEHEGELDMLPAVEEGEEGACEADDAIEDAAEAEAQQQQLLASGDSTNHAAAAIAAGASAGRSLLSSSQCTADLLVAAAAVGLVPRPGSGCHLASSGGGSGLLLLHLDATPLTIRSSECQPACKAVKLQLGCGSLGQSLPAGSLQVNSAPACRAIVHACRPFAIAGRESDADHLYWLQSYPLGGNLQRSALSMQQIQQQLPPLYGSQHQLQPLCWVAEIGGYPAAALMLQPAAQQQHKHGRIGQVLEVLLAAVFPEMEQSAEVFAALASYALQQLLADSSVAEVVQGNLLLLPAMQRQAADASGASPASGAPGALLLRFTSSSPQQQWLRRSLKYAAGCSLDLLASAVAAHMQDLAAGNPDASGAAAAGNLAAASADAASVAAVVRAARRLSSMWTDGPAASPGAEEAAAEELFADATAVVTGFMEAAGFPSECVLLQCLAHAAFHTVYCISPGAALLMCVP